MKREKKKNKRQHKKLRKIIAKSELKANKNEENEDSNTKQLLDIQYNEQEVFVDNKRLNVLKTDEIENLKFKEEFNNQNNNTYTERSDNLIEHSNSQEEI